MCQAAFILSMSVCFGNRGQQDSNETHFQSHGSSSIGPTSASLDEQQQHTQNDEIERAIQKIYELKHIIETNAVGLNLNLSGN